MTIKTRQDGKEQKQTFVSEGALVDGQSLAMYEACGEARNPGCRVSTASPPLGFTRGGEAEEKKQREKECQPYDLRNA